MAGKQEIPRELQDQLITDYEARKAWTALAPAKQKAAIERVEEATSAATRKKRALEVLWSLNPKLKPLPPETKAKRGAIPADLQARLDRSFTAREQFKKLGAADRQVLIDSLATAKSPAGRDRLLHKITTDLITWEAKKRRASPAK